MHLIAHHVGVLWKPRASIARFLQCERRLRDSLYTMLLFGISYTVAVIVAYATHHLPYGVPLALRIPIDEYYLYEALLLLPITIATWVMFAGLVQLLSLPFHGRGTFEDTLAVTGLPFVALIVFMLIPDVLVDYVLPSSITTAGLFVRVLNPARLLAASLWLFVLHIIVVRAVQQLSLVRATLITVVAYVPYLGITMTYIR